MAKLPYETAYSSVEEESDVILFSTGDQDNAFLDPWNMIPKVSL